MNNNKRRFNGSSGRLKFKIKKINNGKQADKKEGDKNYDKKIKRKVVQMKNKRRKCRIKESQKDQKLIEIKNKLTTLHF